MSSTITETERQTIPKSSGPETNPSIMEKRSKFARSGSIEKLKQINNFVCSQHHYLLPGLLPWLKTSRTILKTYMESCIVYLQSMFVITLLREFLQQRLKMLQSDKNKDKIATILNLATIDALTILNIMISRTKQLIKLLFEDFKKFLLVTAVYFSVVVIFSHLFIGLAIFLMLPIPPLGFFFLIGCLFVMARVAVKVMIQDVCPEKDDRSPEERRRIRRQLTYIGKSISNVKLF